MWLGASLFFLGLASRVGSVIESRHAAGDVVTMALGLFDAYGVLAGPAILVTLFMGWLPLSVPLRSRAFGAVVMTAAVIASRSWATPKIVAAKAAMSLRLEYMDPASPLMEQYRSFHTVSSGLMVVHVIACFLMLIAAVRASRPRRSFRGIEL